MRESSIIDLYTKEQLEDLVNNNKTYSDILTKMGYIRKGTSAAERLRTRLKLLNIDYSHLDNNFIKYKTSGIAREDNEVFCENSIVVQSTVVSHYSNKVPRTKCSICGQTDKWNGKKLVLILDHINGIYNDNRIENLRWVCPNCNSQLKTTGGGNKQRKCVDCSKIISKNLIRCEECNEKWLKKINYNIDYYNGIPEKTKLKELVRKYKYSEIYKLYGIGYHRLYNWLRDYQLPKLKSEIMTFSDEEWNNL